MHKCSSIVLFILILAFTTVGCEKSGIVKLRAYPGQDRSMASSAILKCTPYIKIINLDGNPDISISSQAGINYTGCEIALLPGKHSINLCYENFSHGYAGSPGSTGNLIGDLITIGLGSYHTSLNATECDPRVMEFSVEAGHIYRLHAEIMGQESGLQYTGKEKFTARISIYDSTDRDRSLVYSERVRIQKQLAEEAGDRDDWPAASMHRKNAVELGIKGQLPRYDIADLYLDYGRSLAVICNYVEAEAQLKESFKINDTYAGKSYIPLITLAHIHYQQRDIDGFNGYVDQLTSSYKADIDGDNIYDYYALTSEQKLIAINPDNYIFDELSGDYAMPYGTLCKY